MESLHWKYYFSDFDDRTLRHPLDEETYSYIVCPLVDRLWSEKRYWRRHINDEESHQLYIDALRSRYKFPDYLEVVGPPAPEHYDENGNLTTQRKSALLLIGVFDWQGIRIAKHQAKFGFNILRGWNKDKRYTSDQKGWYVPVARNRPEAKTLTVRDYFSPLRNYRCQRLEDYLTEDHKYSKVILRDKNPYNCHPDNIEIVSTRGRPKICVSCERRVTDKNSKRIRLSGKKMRYCVNCLADLGRRVADDEGRLI